MVQKESIGWSSTASVLRTPTLRAFLREARDTLTSLQQEPTTHPTTNAILREVQAVHEAVKGLATPPASSPASPRPTWAQIATSLPPTPPKSPVPSIEGPELTIRISDIEERKSVQSLPNADGRELVAVRKLPSGDLRLFLTNERTKAALLLHIHNCYNPPPKLLTSRNLATLQLLPQALSHPGEHMLVGDFNLHHPLWGETLLPTQHTLAHDLIEATTRGNMELILSQGTVTWKSGNSMSTLDLTFATSGIAEQVLQCQPCEELDSNSDHIPIITSIETSVPQQTERPAQPQWRKADWKKVRERLKYRLEVLDQDHLNDTSDLDRRQTNKLEALDERVAQLQMIIQDTVRDTIPLAKPSRWIRTGWSDECTESVKRARRARRKWVAQGSQEAYINYRGR
ncbi:hypothetical protein KC340_g1239 [Hortaea werneckii]|nr:hypothetical protein KC339_g2809 [Hortaea werneckii]KAI7224571.1 hypothetical protein KC365_g10597 [Hortaea werneckii]KAI7337669.1 hypothetical protein KC340_g1239 [Hortaea werneckii]KAI7386831.1 hypothetical protein KC328_g9714 [Hortaea werneckii]